MSLIPTIGVLVVLTLVSSVGIALLGANRGLEKRLDDIKESPYMAFFGKGHIYKTTTGRSDEIDEAREESLAWWRTIAVSELVEGYELDTGLGEKRSFSGVFPLREVYLDVQRLDNKDFMPHVSGLAIEFGQGNRAAEASADEVDSGLIERITKSLAIGRIFRNSDEEGVILSIDALERFGWDNSSPFPKVVWVRLYRKSGKRLNRDAVGIPVVGVSRSLPYRYQYVMTTGQVNRLNGDYYYTEDIRQFKIGIPIPPNPDETQLYKRIAAFRLPRDWKIGKARKIGKWFAVSVKTANPESILNIRGPWWTEGYPDVRLWTRKSLVQAGEGFDGAIFHVNPDLLKSGTETAVRMLEAFEGAMSARKIQVEGELVEALKENVRDQARLMEFGHAFSWALVPMSIVVVMFFALVLYTRMHRIGVLRMQGVPDLLFIVVYSFEGILLLLISFLLGVMLNIQFDWIELSAKSLFASDVAVLLGKLTLGVQAGIILPVVLTLNGVQTSEMISYRT